MVVRGGSWRAQRFPAIVGLLKHPSKGYLLFDTGYAKHFLAATQPLPERCYRWLTPMHLCDKQQLITQLACRGIAPEDIKYLFISHFHADHIAGLLDFPSARYVCSRTALTAFTGMSRIAALLKGYLPALLPKDFDQRVIFIEDLPPVDLGASLAPFQRGYDVFGDGAYLAVSLPGHAHGHYGLLLAHQRNTAFLVGDAAWTRTAFTESRAPHWLAGLILSDKTQYLQTLSELAQLYGANRELHIIPAHCQQSYDAFLAQTD